MSEDDGSARGRGRPDPYDTCDNCGEPANRGDERSWYIARFQSSDPDDSSLHIRGVLCDECSHGLGHGIEETDTDQ